MNKVFGFGCYDEYLVYCLFKWDVKRLILGLLNLLVIFLNICGFNIYFVWLLNILDFVLVFIFLYLGKYVVLS